MPRTTHQTALTHKKCLPADPLTERLPHSIDHKKMVGQNFPNTFSLPCERNHISLCLVKLADPSNIRKTNDGPGKQSSILLHYLGITWSIMAFKYQFYQEWGKKTHNLKYSTNSGLQLCCRTSRLRMTWCISWFCNWRAWSLMLIMQHSVFGIHSTPYTERFLNIQLEWQIQNIKKKIQAPTHEKINWGFSSVLKRSTPRKPGEGMKTDTHSQSPNKHSHL